MQNIKEQVEKYVALVNSLNEPEGDIFYAEYGRRYAKVRTSRYVHTFIDLNNGDILKAATYKAPAPNGVRGNIFADDLGKSVITKYGAAYLR